MENSELAFSLEGVDYRADPHIWDDHPNRIGLVTIERIRDTIRAPSEHDPRNRNGCDASARAA